MKEKDQKLEEFIIKIHQTLVDVCLELRDNNYGNAHRKANQSRQDIMDFMINLKEQKNEK
jgi:hypothetical protein